MVLTKVVGGESVLDGNEPSLEGGAMSAFSVFDTKQESVSILAPEHLFKNSNIGLKPSTGPIFAGLSCHGSPVALEVIAPNTTDWVIQRFIFGGW